MPANVKNQGTAIGRLTRDAKLFENKDGSHKAVLTIAVRDNFRTKGEYGTQFVPVEAFVPKDSNMLAMYQGLKKGQKIGVAYAVTTPAPYQKDGETVYPVVLQIQSLDTSFESKADRDQRDLAAAASEPVEADLDA